MSNKEKIVYLLAEVKKLENLLAEVQEVEVYPVSFFDQTFELTRELLKQLYQLEAKQVETLRKQMEARQIALQEILIQSVEPVSVEQEKKPLEVYPEQIGLVSVVPDEEEQQPDPEPEEVLEELVDDAIQETVILPEISSEIVIEDIQEEVIDVVSQPEELVIKHEKSIEELLKEYAVPQPLIPEKSITSVSDILEKKKLTDFKNAFSLNDRFYFLRELFQGDDVKMNEVITDLNEIETLEESLDYLNTKMRWNPEEVVVADFIQLLEKRFL